MVHTLLRIARASRWALQHGYPRLVEAVGGKVGGWCSTGLRSFRSSQALELHRVGHERLYKHSLYVSGGNLARATPLWCGTPCSDSIRNLRHM